MDKLIAEMYQDAMLVEDLQETVRQAALACGGPMMLSMQSASERMRKVTEHLAVGNIGAARHFLQVWEKACSGVTDFRQLAYRIETEIMPMLCESLQQKYPYEEAIEGEWFFKRSDNIFFTVQNVQSGRYIHSLKDPMWEAMNLARELYQPGMIEFHLLGCGLGYLAYQIWRVSEKTVKVTLYEDDEIMLKNAWQLGVLSWIDEDYLRIVSGEDLDDMLRLFLIESGKTENGHYISDWKLGIYSGEKRGPEIEALDFNDRTIRVNQKQWMINRLRNSRLPVSDIRELKRTFKTYKKKFAVISAGPSMEEGIPFLKIHAKELTIISINASLKRLYSEGIHPDIIVMLDPLPGLRQHLNGIEDYTIGTPLIMPANGSSTFAEAFRGKIYILSEDEDETDGFRWMFGGTVSSMALDIAYFFGASEIYLIGNDLAYAGGKNYAGGGAHAENEGMIGEQQEILVPSVDGGTVRTNPLYNTYRKRLELQIKAHPEAIVYNMSKHGARIQGTLNFWN